MKAVRSAELHAGHPEPAQAVDEPTDEIEERLHAACDDERLFAVFEALKRGIDRRADPRRSPRSTCWFLDKLQNLARHGAGAGAGAASTEELLSPQAKKHGLSRRDHRRGFPASELTALRSASASAALQDGGHLRRGVRRRDPLLLLHL